MSAIPLIQNRTVVIHVVHNAASRATARAIVTQREPTIFAVAVRAGQVVSPQFHKVVRAYDDAAQPELKVLLQRVHRVSLTRRRTRHDNLSPKSLHRSKLTRIVHHRHQFGITRHHKVTQYRIFRRVRMRHIVRATERGEQ